MKFGQMFKILFGRPHIWLWLVSVNMTHCTILHFMQILLARVDGLTATLEAKIKARSINDLHTQVYREDTRRIWVPTQMRYAKILSTSKFNRTGKSNIEWFYRNKKEYKIVKCHKKKRVNESHKKGSDEDPHELLCNETGSHSTQRVVDPG